MRKYLLYLALLVMICAFFSCFNETSKKQKPKGKMEDTVQVDSIEKQIRAAESELNSFLKND